MSGTKKLKKYSGFPLFCFIIPCSLFVLAGLTSCRTLRPHEMFEVPHGFQYASDTSTIKNKEYLIAPKDKIDMHFYSIEGFKLVDVTSSTSSANDQEGISYIVEEDGQVKLPVIGKVPIVGMTMRQAERYLEEKYSKYYVNPFILLKVTNRRVYVFFGDNGHGHIVTLQNDNTTILEAIALAGGITENSKAWRIKIIRGDLHNPQVHIVDLSTIEGIKSSDLSVQSNDIIYIEAKSNYMMKVLVQITPIIGILTAIFLVVNLVNK